MLTPILLAAALEIVSEGRPRARIEADGSAAAQHAADLVRRYVVLISGVALPRTGALPPLRFESGKRPGYALRVGATGAVIRGRDPVRGAYDLLERWGCGFAPETIPKRKDLAVEPAEWRPARSLWIETDTFDPAWPAAGVAWRGIGGYEPGRFAAARALGYTVRVASESFDDFLPTSHFKTHPEWFALRGGEREARGNFALTNAEARRAYLDALSNWLDAHPEVDVVGIWPEVTSVWCEESAAFGHAESYALLWRAAAARFPARRFEILATGLTLRPPAGSVPKNVDVRFRPGRESSGLQGIAGQPIAAVAQSWKARGATVVLEIDAAPESWCGLPWPCHDAVRANADLFDAAVLRGGGAVHARLWRDPATRRGPEALLDRAARVASWGHPRDAGQLFHDPEQGIAFRIGATERLLAVTMKDRDANAANDVWANYVGILADLPADRARVYKRFRARDMRRMLEELLPQGATRKVGPATVTESFEQVVVETDTLRLVIDRDQAAVLSLKRRSRDAWGPELCGSAFDVVALDVKAARTEGVVDLSSPATGRLRIDLRGRLRPGGPGWRSRLDLRSGSARIEQAADIEARGPIALGCTFDKRVFDRWVCPPHAREGVLAGPARSLPLPPRTLLYLLRRGEQRAGLAVRLPRGGRVTPMDEGLVVTGMARAMQAEWIVFLDQSELGR
jgi:hypothetical protein